jgi:cellulose synthase/poly-beta-1,6-N-acetylglucosamine synthase-like glycosyltransferase/spore germination protein YaaH/peptidoglycan/xylan/chitin deacetylase (PgdA/CDA1 family)
MKKQVFHDPSGRRGRLAGQVVASLLALATLLTAGFAATLVLSPRLPSLTLKDPRSLTALHVETPRHTRGKPAWSKVPQHAVKAGRGGAAEPLNVGFYVSWDSNSRGSLAAHIKDLDIVSPQWVALTGNEGAFDVTSDPQASALIAAAPNKPAVLPLVHNSANASFDSAQADAILGSPTARATLIKNLVDLAQARGFGGYIFDLENLSPRAAKLYPGFIAQARAALAKTDRRAWVTAPFDGEDWPIAALGKASDAVVLMAYDQHYGTGEPGPAAGQDWFQENLALRFKELDPSKIIMALGAYGYDWTAKAPGQPGRADAVTFHEAMVLAHDAGVTVGSDPDSLNPTFAYQDDAGRDHSVWFLDAVAAFNEVRVTDPWRPMGYGLWRLGSEDPGVWTVLGQPYGSAKADSLRAVRAGPDVDFDGTGEVLKVTATPTAGRRSLTIDPATGLVSTYTYDVLPAGYVVQRYGAHPGLVALTFDDGPDPRWTPKLLDILKAKHAPATFFVIGENMQERPDLVRREIAEGHMVGSHTWTHPNIGEIPNTEVVVELTATQRLFETITGKSMRLFRPPFFGDAEPSTPREVLPLLAAQKLGYLIVGLRIDPDDWKKPDPTHIVNRTIERLADKNPETGGQIVLLHDAGGDRSRTVKALPVLIDTLRAHGYRLVTVAELAGMTPAQALPPASRTGADLLLDRLGFGFFRGVDAVLRALFVTAIVLGLARLAFLAVLALVHRFRAPGLTPAPLDPAAGPLVSVLIPCFNEEKVIASSVAGILQSDWLNLEIIVLDDGSKDGTAAEVERHFADEPRVRLMRFENGGKAVALNRGLVLAKGEIVVALDADTQFAPDTIGLLARWFENPLVGAVAGNAIVGNRVNLVTRWQALEYVTAQNLERRALAALGCVTVVPGAVGAWRKSALLELGGYPPETLAEDQDLTLSVQRAGWRVEFDSEARAYTEAPDTVGGLLKQRFRWSFGTLQCLWKHRAALFDTKRPVLGFVALPQIWLFQIVLATAAPLVDLAIVWSLIAAGVDRLFHPVEWQPDNLILALLYWAIFILVDLSASALGMAMERRAPWGDIGWLPAQRFGYRQLMYYVVIKAVTAAVHGRRVGWGVLERRATVTARR